MAAQYLVLNLPKGLALGSCLDLGPALHKAFKAFNAEGTRTIISASRNAAHLFRHRFEEAAAQGTRIIVPGPSYQRSFEEIRTLLAAPGANCLGIPFADNRITSEDSYLGLHKLTPLSGIRIGLTNVANSVKWAFKRYTDEDRPDYSFDPGLGIRGAYFDHEIEPGFPAVNTPFFLNANLEAVNLAARLAGLEHSIRGGTEKRPMIWTSPKEVEAARRFFDQNSLAPETTIGIHLTASSGDPYKDMLSEDDFFAVSKYFINNGHTVLLVAGNTFGTPPNSADENYDTHIGFLDRLKSEYSSSRYQNSFRMFYGDVLTQAEIIRLCGRGFLSGETGPAHLASAVGTPKVTIASRQAQADMYMMLSPFEIGLIGLQTYQTVIETMKQLWERMDSR